jgi:putative transposase
MPLPDRKWPSHARPSWVDENDPIFLTLCGQPRKLNQFATPESWAHLVAAAEHLRTLRKCPPMLMLAMPDHVHMIVSIPLQPGINDYIRRFKRATSYETTIHWQPWAYDHRIRDEVSLADKWSYILANPARAGLVSPGQAWPYLKIWTSR